MNNSHYYYLKGTISVVLFFSTAHHGNKPFITLRKKIFILCIHCS